MSIGRRIREARLAAGLSQEELAAACEVNQGTVSAWETVEGRRIGGAHLMAVAAATGASVAWLRTGQDEPTARYTEGSGDGAALASRLYRLAGELAEIAAAINAGEAVSAEEAARRVEAVQARRAAEGKSGSRDRRGGSA